MKKNNKRVSTTSIDYLGNQKVVNDSYHKYEITYWTRDYKPILWDKHAIIGLTGC